MPQGRLLLHLEAAGLHAGDVVLIGRALAHPGKDGGDRGDALRLGLSLAGRLGGVDRVAVSFAFSGRWFIWVKSLALGSFRLQAGSDAPSRHDASTAVVTLDIALRPVSRQYLG